jgi:pyroglutamyl-peptidase
LSLLITAFGPFEGGPNCSDALLGDLAGKRADLERLWGGSVAFQRFVVDTEAIGPALQAAIAAHAPSHLLMMGQAAGRSALALERCARNHRDLRAPDDMGRLGRLGPVRRGGPDLRRATWPDLDGAAAAARAAAVPCEVSDDAGAHLCNQSLYLAVEAAEHAPAGLAATFLHLPLLPEQVAAGTPAATRFPSCPALPMDDMARAVFAILRHTRRLEGPAAVA